jgi:hypothetical protein
VFASSLHALDLVCRLNGLQIAASGVLEEYVLGRYERMQHAWKAARERLRPGQWMEIRFEELVRAPADALKRVYDEMDLGGWSNAAPSVRAFLAGREGYRQNRLVTSPEQRERVRVRWGEWVRGYGYEPVRRPSAATPAFCP